MVKIDTKASLKGLLSNVDDNGDITVMSKDETDVINIVKLVKKFEGYEIILSISKSEKGDLNEK